MASAMATLSCSENIPVAESIWARAEPGFPCPGHAEVRGDLQNADAGHNRLAGHDKRDAASSRDKIE
jgi:hypothetical protein